MSSFLFLIAVVGVLLLIVWLMRNDAPGLGGGEGGIFSMKPPIDQQQQPGGRAQGWRRYRR